MPIRLSAREGAALVGGRRSKYGAIRSEYGGRTYDSRAEMVYAQLLDIRKQAGEILDHWPQQAIPLRVNGVLVAKLIADFKILHRDKSIEFVDVKGFETPVFRLKLKLLRACDPAVKYTVIPSKYVR